jgi:hypothetical protein
VRASSMPTSEWAWMSWRIAVRAGEMARDAGGGVAGTGG